MKKFSKNKKYFLISAIRLHQLVVKCGNNRKYEVAK